MGKGVGQLTAAAPNLEELTLTSTRVGDVRHPYPAPRRDSYRIEHVRHVRCQPY